MSIWDRTFEFETLGRRYTISRRPPADALSSHVAAEVVRNRAREDRRFRSSLAQWAWAEGYVWTSGDELRIVDELVRTISAGMVRVHMQPISEQSYAERFARLQLEGRASPPAPLPPLITEEVVDSHRSLLITHCPSEFDPRREPLRISYLLRDLHGFPVELTIHSEATPEPPVHRRVLSPAETIDGPNKLEWNGEHDDTGELVVRDAAPFVVQLAYDTTYRDHASTTLPPAPAVVVIGSDIDNPNDDLLCYRHGSAVFGLRAVPRSGAAASPTGFVATVLRHAASERDHVAMIAGHTDTSGKDATNLALSADRAENLKLFLTDTAAAWAEHCGAIAEIDDMQSALAWAADELGWKCHPGNIDGDLGPKTRAAVKGFRSAFNDAFSASLAGPDELHVPDWEALRSLYDMAIAELLSSSVEDLEAQRGALHLHELPTLACGERYPQADVNRNGFRCTDNRRVDVLFFPRGDAPETSPGEDAIAQDVYLGQYRVTRIDVMPATVTTLNVRHRDGRSCPGATVTVALSDGIGTRSIRCDELGRARLYGMSGWRYVVRRVTEADDCFICDVMAGRSPAE